MTGRSMLRSIEKNCLLLKTCCSMRHCHFTGLAFEVLRVPYLGHGAMLHCRDTATALFPVYRLFRIGSLPIVPKIFKHIFSIQLRSPRSAR
jgi:hypothetical protein